MLRSDGKKGVIDCGPGIDQVIINEDVDGDVAIDCESVKQDKYHVLLIITEIKKHPLDANTLVTRSNTSYMDDI